MTANNSNGSLSGPLKLKSVDTSYGGGQPEEVTTETLSGNFAAGLPNGKFVFNSKQTQDGASRQSENFSATFNKGMLTGAFLWKTGDEEIKGSFTSSGALNGKWSVKGKTYEFKNGVLINGGNLSSEEKSYAIKFANNQITEQQLFEKGMIVEKQDLEIYEKFASRLGGLIHVADPLETTNLGKDNLGDNYKVITQGTFFTEKGYNDFVERFIHSGKRISKDEYINSLDHFTCLDEERGVRFGVEYSYNGIFDHTGPEWVLPGLARGYYFTNDQLERVKKEVEKHNLDIDKQKMAVYQPRINSDYINHKGAEINIENVGHDIIAVRMLKLNRESGAMKVEIDTREYKQQADDNYILYSYEADYDGNTLSNLTPIRNKYSDIVDAKKAAEKEAEPTFTKINALINDYSILKGNLLEKQVIAFVTHYNDKVHNVEINHDNLDETLTSLKSQIPVIQNFNTLLPKYVEASKLNSQIVKQQIAKYTTTAMPQLTTWSTEAKCEEVDKVIEEQKQVLKLWETLAPLMEKVKKAHSALAASNDPILSGYKGLYTTASKKTTLEEAITAYTNFIPAQEKALAQWKEYSALKEKGDKGHRTLAAANDPILADYYKTYNTVANTKESFEAGIAAYNSLFPAQEKALTLWNEYSKLKNKADKTHSVLVAANDPLLAECLAAHDAAAKTKSSLEAGIAAYNNLIPKMENTLKSWEKFSTLRKQATRTHNAICAANLPVMGEYTALYDTTVKGITSLDNGIAAYNKIIATQQNATKYIGIYNEVVANHTTLPSTIKPAKCASKAYKVYYEGLNLNWKAEGAVEKITKIWTIQQSLAKIPSRATLKDDEKRVKKAKLTDIEEIIKSYFNGENVNVGEPKAEFIIKDIVEPKAETKVEKKSEKIEKKAEAVPSVKAETKTEYKNAKTTTKVEATPSVKTEKKPHNQAIAAIKPGFGQYVEVSPMLNMISTCDHSLSTNINYIAGYRFNKNLFLGVGTGLNLYFGHSTTFYYSSFDSCDDYDASLALFSIPAYLHFRADFGKRAKLWNPYASISAGAQFGIFEPQRHLANRFYFGHFPGSPYHHPLHECHNELNNYTKRNMEGFVSFDFGANRRLTDKLSISFGVGYKVGLRNSIRVGVSNYSYDIYNDTALTHGIKFNIGLSF